MNLTFDNLEEFDAFLRWADKYQAASTVAKFLHPDIDARPIPHIYIDPAQVAGDVAEAASGAAGTSSLGTLTTVDGGASGSAGDTKPADNPEPAKRKRRTKAEIESDEADAAIARAAASAVAKTGEAPEGAQGANPFEQAAAPAGDGGDETPPADVEPDESVVTPFQHLTRAREFIAKHGMPKYNESFTKAGLDANVMAYSAFQRALHITALDELEKA